MGVLTNVDEIINFKEEVAKIASASAQDPRVDELALTVEQLSGSILTVQGEVEDKVDTDVIADEYDPEGSSGYSKGDAVLYEGNLYVANQAVPNQAGEWKIQRYVPEYDPTNMYPYTVGAYVTYEGSLYIALQQSQAPYPHYPTEPEYWEVVEDVDDFDASETYSNATIVKYLGGYAYASDTGRMYNYGAIPIDAYAEGTAYNTGTYVVYNSGVYKALQTTSTTWVDEEWDNVDAEDWSSTSSFVRNDVILHSGSYYSLNYNYKNLGQNGAFDSTKWDIKTVEEYVGIACDNVKVKSTGISLYGITTDEHGLIDSSDIANLLPSRATPIDFRPVPYSGMAPAGTSGFSLTRVNSSYYLLESIVDGVRTPVASATLDAQYYFVVAYI